MLNLTGDRIMFNVPFSIERCSWPMPVDQDDGHWVSEPDWQAPEMPYLPQPRWQSVGDELCWMIDWRDYFRGDLKIWSPEIGGEMRGFHVIFELKIQQTGLLVFWDDDGSVILHNGNKVHEDRSAHNLRHSSIKVKKGDILTIAQWQLYGDWLWGATMSDYMSSSQLTNIEAFLPFVKARLQQPSGPPLKVFTNGDQSIRTVLCIYSLILNGYSPTCVLLYGEYQWSDKTRELFSRALPFVQIVPNSIVIDRIQSLGGQRLVDWAMNYWWVMKTCVCLLCEPDEFCQIDDDIFILESTADALTEFNNSHLVYAPDTDHSNGYTHTWLGAPRSIATCRFNAGIYWARCITDQKQIALRMLKVHPARVLNFFWEQGFIACLYRDSGYELPTQTYFYPLFDGLPGGLYGYDYLNNPCGFTSIHFGGLAEKPLDSHCLFLTNDILTRNLADQVADTSAI